LAGVDDKNMVGNIYSVSHCPCHYLPNSFRVGKKKEASDPPTKKLASEYAAEYVKIRKELSEKQKKPQEGLLTAQSEPHKEKRSRKRNLLQHKATKGKSLVAHPNTYSHTF
jgi:hypothetical protein